MKVGAHVEIVGVGLAYEEAFPLLARLGAQGVELVMKEGTALHLRAPDGAFSRAKALAQDCGLEISGLTCAYAWSLPMTSDSARVRGDGQRAVARAIEGAALLGTDSLLLIPGYASTTFVQPAEEIPAPTALERARQGVSDAAAYGGEMGVSVNVEVVWNGILRRAEEMRDFVDGVGSPFVGVYLDTGNVYPDGDPVQWIRTLGGRVRRVHMKDYAPGKPGMEAFGRLGEGITDLPAVVDALRGVGYDGWLGAEHHQARTPAEAAHTLRFLRALAEGDAAS